MLSFQADWCKLFENHHGLSIWCGWFECAESGKKKNFILDELFDFDLLFMDDWVKSVISCYFMWRYWIKKWIMNFSIQLFFLNRHMFHTIILYTCTVKPVYSEFYFCVGIVRMSDITVQNIENMINMTWKSTSDNTGRRITQVSD